MVITQCTKNEGEVKSHPKVEYWEFVNIHGKYTVIVRFWTIPGCGMVWREIRVGPLIDFIEIKRAHPPKQPYLIKGYIKILVLSRLAQK